MVARTKKRKLRGTSRKRPGRKPGTGLTELIGRALTDEDFREKLLRDPGAAARGYKLSKKDLEALKRIKRADLESQAEKIGGRAGITVAVKVTKKISDARLKTDVRELDAPLEKLLKVRGVSFAWRKERVDAPRRTRQIGVIAQELEKQFPEMVTTGPDGFKRVSYDMLTAVLIEAVREQQKEIEQLRALVGSEAPLPV